MSVSQVGQSVGEQLRRFAQFADPAITVLAEQATKPASAVTVVDYERLVAIANRADKILTLELCVVLVDRDPVLPEASQEIRPLQIIGPPPITTGRNASAVFL
jgi:hypothetical protein